MMAKRRVPAALHHELSEYASLMRALRVRDAMDVTKHLVKGSPFLLNMNAQQGLPIAGPSDLNHPSNASQTSPKSDKAKGKQKSSPAPPQHRRRDHWTRWPLPLNDVLVPEWTLDDEIAVIASKITKSHSPIEFPVPVADSEDDMDDDDDEGNGDADEESAIHVLDMDPDSDDPDPPYYVPYLSSIIANYLSVILGILASHTPARPASMQNRIEPLNWRAVLDVVVSCGITEYSNPKVVENVIKRMEAIYGPSILPIEGSKATSFRSVERMQGKNEATERFEARFDRETAKYFDEISIRTPKSPSPSPPPPPLPRTRRNKTDRKDEATYKARKRRAKPYDKPAKGKGKGTVKESHSDSVDGDPTTELYPATATETNAADDDDPSNEQEKKKSARRSARASKGPVNYREILPSEIVSD